ncbi:M14 family zinc carboxypeptidase [Undibacterium sp. RuRC25W]|uniref:M14 family zinc carboxypeptidase n=1 Tax=Undibacterium sp. RuRC25W TaxID=3413047 RepID=UPI003BF0A608
MQWSPLKSSVIASCCNRFYSEVNIKAHAALLIAACASFFPALATAAPSTPAASARSATPASTKTKVVTDWCTPLAARLPKVSVNDCQNAKLQATGTKSLNGFPLLSRDINADSKHPHAIKILLIGGIHGDEQTASAIVFKWLGDMQKSSTQEFQWKVAPVVNPDGLLAPKPRRMNAHGIDLNRNFPTPDWQKEAPAYWSRVTRSDPRRYPGKAPISEPESRWVYDTIEKFKPDVVISVHAPFGVLDFDGPTSPPSRFGRLIYNRVGVYPGSLGNYSGLHKDIPVVTIELPNASQMPPDIEIERIWQDMQKWIRQNIVTRTKATKHHS